MISLQFLKYFHDAAEESSILKASQRNHVSSTAISSAIRKLEDHYAVKLLEHKKNNFKLTEDGVKLFFQLPKLFEEVEHIESIFTEEEVMPAGKIKIATSYSIATSILPGVLDHFNEKFPNFKVEIKIGEHGLIKYWVDKGFVDLGLVVLRGEQNKKFDSVDVTSGTFKLVRKKGARPTNYIVAGDWPEVIDLKKQYKKRHKAQLPVQFESPSWLVAKEFALKGMGIALVPSYLLNNELREIDGLFNMMDYSVSFIFKKGHSLSPSETLFINRLQGIVKE